MSEQHTVLGNLPVALRHRKSFLFVSAFAFSDPVPVSVTECLALPVSATHRRLGQLLWTDRPASSGDNGAPDAVSPFLD